MNRRRDESGAIAVLVALLATFLIALLVFTADFGLAYANKRQVQTAADASALGAAGVYGQVAGTSCTAIRAAGDAAANAEATAKVAQNDDHMPNPGVLNTFTPNCTPDGLLEVRTTVSTTTPHFFSGLLPGGGGDYQLTRSATAVVGAASSVGAGLRPLALCSRDLLSLTSFPTPVMKFEGPAGGPVHNQTDCPDVMNPGNWWTLRCPGETSTLGTRIANGCQNPISLVPGQPAPGDPGLSPYLLNYCTSGPPHPESCLTSDPGNVRDNGSLSALRGLVDSEAMIYLPVFCGTTACNPAAVSTDSGNNTVYPVFRLVAARLCGYHLGNGQGIYSKMTGICANNPSGYDASVGGPQRNYLLLSILQTNVSGGTAPSTCKIGDPCDTGLRQVRMTG